MNQEILKYLFLRNKFILKFKKVLDQNLSD